MPAVFPPNSAICRSHFIHNVSVTPGNPNWRGRLSTVDLTIKVACFCKKVNNVCNIKSPWSKLVSTRTLTELILPLQ
jgi:hypothetical protein